jgi:hypothetical protein
LYQDGNQENLVMRTLHFVSRLPRYLYAAGRSDMRIGAEMVKSLQPIEELAIRHVRDNEDITGK